MHTRKPTVLLIDDEKELLLALSAIMRRAGYEVRTASTGTAGLAEISRNQPDIVVCDVMMPPPDGFEVRARLTCDPETSNIPFLFLTARADIGDRVRGLEAGADDYLVKPFDPAELLARIAAILRRHVWSSEEGHHRAKAELESLRSEATRNLHRELRTPLSIVMATLEIALEADAVAPASGKVYLEDGLAAARRLRNLIQDLTLLRDLDDGHLPEGPHKGGPADWIKAAVENSRQGREPSTQASVEIRVEPSVVPAGPPPVVRHIVEYLVDNALKFAGDAGPIAVELEAAGAGQVRISVIDQGPGVPAALREKVFDRWFKADQGFPRLQGGFGVGLTIARALARDLGGNVVIADTESGCRAVLTLPSAAVSPGAPG